MELITIKSFDNSIDAHLLKIELENQGIQCYIYDEHTVTVFPLYSNAVGGIKVKILKTDLDLAKSILFANNAQIVCPNCNATLDTHCRGSRITKELEYKDFCKCGNSKWKTSKSCVNCSKKLQRKVERPSLEQILKDIEETNYVLTGKKYGVSDNTIRKWIRQYNADLAETV